MAVPAKTICFEGDNFHYLRNKRNVLVYTGYTSRERFRQAALIVLHDPEKDTYYVLHMIVYRVCHSFWDDVDDEEYFDTIELGGVNRMAYPANK